MMNWGSLRDFLAVADAGTFSGAARKLKVSQPTLGRRVQALEEELGVALFIRTTQGLDLTDSGELILDHARHMQDDAFAIERLLTGRENTLSGEVVVSVVEGMGSYWMVDELRLFHQKYPDIRISMKTETAVADLIRREADIAIRLFQPTQMDLIAKKAGSIVFGLYASEAYLERCGTPEKLQDLADHDFVLPSVDLISIVESKLAEHNIPVGRLAFKTNNMIALLNAIVCGYGIGLHSCLSGNRSPGLVRLFPEIDVMGVDFWLVTHQELKRSARIRAVFDFLSDLFERNRAAFLGNDSQKPAA
jgi:DNA-binding transcriptional LysR family regulator